MEIREIRVYFFNEIFRNPIAWADPEKELVNIFLSNCTYPDATTNTLSKENVREDIQKVI